MTILHTLLLSIFTLFGAAPPPRAQHVHPSPPPAPASAGTSTLTADQVSQLRAGDGMGLAKAGELNGYPGPKHVLEFADALALTPEQRTRVETIGKAMLADAQRVGGAIVEQERALDEAFKSGAISESDLNARVLAIAALQGELRVVHLSSHLSVASLLTAVQVKKYVELRSSAQMQ